MHKEDLLLFYDYTSWANRRLLAAAALLAPEQFYAAQPTTYGSLRGILEHLLVAYLVWHARIEGRTIEYPDTADLPTLDALVAKLDACQAALRDTLLALDEGALARPVEYRTSKGELYQTILWQIILHLLNHTTQHRSEAAEVLTQLGHSPGDLDFIVYLRQKV